MNEKVYEKAIKLLGIRQHTTGELHQKLKLRKYRDQDIVPVLRELERLRFLDDERFAQIFVENMKLYKDWGYFGIKAKLLKKYIPSDLADQALAQFYTLEDEIEVAERLVAKLKKRGRKAYEQLARSLSSKGFRNEIIGKVLN